MATSPDRRSLARLVLDPATGALCHPVDDPGVALADIEAGLWPATRELVREACEQIGCSMTEWAATLLIIARERQPEIAGLMDSMSDDAMDWYLGALVAERIKGRRDVQQTLKRTMRPN